MRPPSRFSILQILPRRNFRPQRTFYFSRLPTVGTMQACITVLMHGSRTSWGTKRRLTQAQDLLGDVVEVPATHTVVELWTTCSVLLERVSPGDSLEEQRQIGRLLREFAAVDPTSTAFRYPVDKKGNLSLQGIEQINIPNVRDVIGKIALILEGAAAQMDHYADCMSDNYIYGGY